MVDQDTIFPSHVLASSDSGRPQVEESAVSDNEAEGWGSMAVASGIRSRLTLLRDNPVMGQPIPFKLEVMNFGDKVAVIDP